MPERMITRLPPLRALAAFEAAARNLSFQKAAAELNVTPSAVSQQIRVLEDTLAVTLFNRLNRRILLTEAGELYYASVASAFGSMAEATERIHHHLNPQILMIRSSPSFAVKWLLPRLPEFMALHPEFDVRLDATNEKTDFGREAVDVEFRVGSGDWRGLHVEPIHRDTFVPLACPGLIQDVDLKTPSDLGKGVRLIHSVRCPVTWEMWLAANNVPPSVGFRGPRFDRSFMAIQAATDGLGVALDSEVLAEADLREGRLVIPFRGRQEFVRQILWMVCPFENLQRSTVVRFREWLLEHPEMRGDRRAPEAALQPA
ncbi:MAG TPA: transcriptional regulator GcvA [Actinomycetota bacterium]|nr:transcriptional regulator GcvA [Actinomycetota bacterium]